MAVPKEYEVLGGGKDGSFAKVYKVRHKELGHVRAIRVLKDPIVAKDDEELKKDKIYVKFLRETEVLLKLGNGSHPHIESINTYGTFQDSQFPSEHIAYWERNYIQGDNLAEYLKENGNFVPVEEVLRMAVQISSALAYCHEEAYRFLMDPDKDKLPDGCVVGSEVEDEKLRNDLIERYKVIHNDIHLKNILRRTDGNFILIDFGMAVEGEEAPTLSRCQGGAEISRAPELWNGNSKTEPTKKSDVYSFGVVLYAWLAGRYPFPDDERLMDAHQRQWPPPAIESARKGFFEKKFSGETYKRDYPQWLENVILKCLSKNPNDRFRNGKELYECIKAHCKDTNNVKFEMAIDQLKSENKLLSARANELRDTNASLNKQLNSAQNALNRTQQTLRETRDQLHDLKEQLTARQRQHNKGRAPFWISLAIFGLLGVGASLYAWNNSPAEWDRKLKEKDQAVASANDEINELRTIISDLQDDEVTQVSPGVSSNEINRLNNLILQKDRKIRNLEDLLSKEKPSDNAAEIANLRNQISQKNQQIKNLESQLSNQKSADNFSEVKRLNSIVTQKDQKIQELQSIIQSKNKEINALNAAIGGK